VGVYYIPAVTTKLLLSGSTPLELTIHRRERTESKEIPAEEILQEDYNESDPDRPNLIRVVLSGKHGATKDMAGLVMCEKIGKE